MHLQQLGKVADDKAVRKQAGNRQKGTDAGTALDGRLLTLGLFWPRGRAPGNASD